MDDYISLSIDVAHQHCGWVAERLAELGFLAFEEQPRGRRMRILIYDASEQRLRSVQARLLELASARSSPIALGFTLRHESGTWALGWTEHLRPERLTPRLTLYPEAPRGAPAPDGLYLKPAFAFGFGEHPTTRLIATWLELWCQTRAGASVLDVGCGTGVLALVAARSGAGRVVGVDSSRPAIEAARSNASLNGLEAGVTFSERGAEALAGEFDCVVANIEANVLQGACPAIAGALAPLGELALAGFIEEQEAALINCYGAAGVTLARMAQEGDWCLLAGRRARRQ